MNQSITILLGAVPDARAVRDFLLKQLGVPSLQIRNLHDGEATRAVIIDNIKAFLLNDEVEEGIPF